MDYLVILPGPVGSYESHNLLYLRFVKHTQIFTYANARKEKSSLVTTLCAPPGEKQCGEQSQISWAHYPTAVKTSEITRSVIIRVDRLSM